MTRAHVLRTFRKAGFPLDKGRMGNRSYSYGSSVVSVRFTLPCYPCDPPTLTVWTHWHDSKDFDSAAEALTYIRRILAVQVVGGNDWALNTGPRGELRLVGGAA